MSESPAPSKIALDALLDKHDNLIRNHAEQLDSYQKAGRLGRWLIAKRYPEVAEYVADLDALQRTADAE